jgi:hypothetical protein
MDNPSLEMSRSLLLTSESFDPSPPRERRQVGALPLPHCSRSPAGPESSCHDYCNHRNNLATSTYLPPHRRPSPLSQLSPPQVEFALVALTSFPHSLHSPPSFVFRQHTASRGGRKVSFSSRVTCERQDTQAVASHLRWATRLGGGPNELKRVANQASQVY